MPLSLKEMIREIRDKCDILIDMEIGENQSSVIFQDFCDIQIFMHEFIQIIEKDN